MLPEYNFLIRILVSHDSAYKNRLAAIDLSEEVLWEGRLLHRTFRMLS